MGSVATVRRDRVAEGIAALREAASGAGVPERCPAAAERSTGRLIRTRRGGRFSPQPDTVLNCSRSLFQAQLAGIDDRQVQRVRLPHQAGRPGVHLRRVRFRCGAELAQPSTPDPTGAILQDACRTICARTWGAGRSMESLVDERRAKGRRWSRSDACWRSWASSLTGCRGCPVGPGRPTIWRSSGETASILANRP